MQDLEVIEQGKTDKKIMFVELKAKGWSLRKIEKEIDVNIGTLSNWNKSLEYEISTLKAIQLEELYSKYYMNKEARIKEYGELLEELKKERKKRKLDDIPTAKLIELEMKQQEILKMEYILPYYSNKDITEINIDDIEKELLTLLDRVRQGELTNEQVSQEINIIMQVLKTKEINEIDKKQSQILAILEGRKVNEKK